MTSQALDVGDEVMLAEHHTDRTGLVVGIEDGEVTVCWQKTSDKPWYAQQGWTADRLKRVGGPLQKGDFVAVEGEVVRVGRHDVPSAVEWPRAVIVDIHPKFGEALIVPDHRTDVWRVPVTALNRITRAEALA